MTSERFDEDQVGQRLAQVLETEAKTIEVGDAWDAIASRLLDSDLPSARLSPVSPTRRRRRVLGVVAAGIGVAAAIVLAVILGWRPQF
jgi:ferric-dicitrate binding protein FerR (iron transport regulator)